MGFQFNSECEYHKSNKIPKGWVKGRNAWNKKEKIEYSPIECCVCNAVFAPRGKNGRFCSKACCNRHRYENACMVKIIRNKETREIKEQNYNAYKKCGWSKI